MLAYLSIFEGELYAVAILVILTVISFVIFRSSFVLRAILVNPGVWLAPIFYLLYVVLEQRISPEIVMAFLFEACVLAVYLKLFLALLRGIEDMAELDFQQYARWLMNGVFMQLAIVAYFLVQGEFGLFAEGSRIEYLADSKLNLYLTYLGMLIGGVSTPIAAAIVSRNRGWNGVVLLVLGVVFTGLTINYVGEFLQLYPGQMVSLMFARIFLVNDGRALAIDLSNVFGGENYSLFRESFRTAASILGNPPANMPLGQLLYSEAFGTEGLLGANTSSTALLIAYGDDVEKIIFLIVLLVILATLYWAVSRSTAHLLPRIAFGLLLLIFLSQDFLAFQLCMNITIAGFILLSIYRILRHLAVNASKVKPKSLGIK